MTKRKQALSLNKTTMDALEASLLRKLGCKPPLTNDYELVSRFSPSLTAMVFALLARYAKRAWAERCRGVEATQRDLFDAFSFLTQAADLKDFLHADAPTQKSAIVYFFRLAAILSAPGQAQAHTEQPKGLRTNFDVDELRELKTWILAQYRAADLQWVTRLQEAHASNHQRWQAKFQEELHAGIKLGDLASVSAVERRYGLLGRRRLDQLCATGKLLVDPTGGLSLP